MNIKKIKNKLKSTLKKGYISIEAVILFSLLTVGGIALVNQTLDSGVQLATNAEQFTNSLIRVDEKVEGPIHITGEGTSILRPTVNDVVVDPPSYDPDADENDGVVHVSSIVTNPTHVDLFIGETATITYSVNPSNAENKTVAFQSDNTAIATVTQQGKITGIAEGDTLIYVYSLDNGRFGRTSVTVKPILSTEIQVTPTSVVMNVGEKIQLSAKVLPENATNKNITYRSSDSSIVSVDENGLITALSATPANNKAVVTVSDGRHEKLVQVEVIGEIIPVEAVEVNKTSITIEIGETFQVLANVYPTNATVKTIVYESDNEAIATVSQSGLITGKSVGTTIIQVNNYGGDFYGALVSNAIAVNVVENAILPESLTISYPFTDIEVGDQMEAIVEFTPSDTTNQSVSFTVSDPAVLSVDRNGKITAVGVGTATVRAISEKDPSIYAEFVVKTHGEFVETTSVEVTPGSLTLQKGETYQLTETVYPLDASNKGVTWSTTDSSVITVSPSGVITAVGFGEATVTATTINGGHKAQVKVTIPYVQNTGLIVEPESVTLGLNETRNLSVTILPANSTYKTYTYSISDTSIFKMSGDTIIPLAHGSAVLTITTHDGLKKEVNVTVKELMPSSIEVNKNIIELYRGNSDTLVATVLPEEAENKSITFSVEDPNIATVIVENNVAKVTGVSNGTTTIHISANVDNSVFTSVTVIVKAILPERIEISPTSLYLETGETAFVNRTVYPVTADNKNVHCAIKEDPSVERVYVTTVVSKCRDGFKLNDNGECESTTNSSIKEVPTQTEELVWLNDPTKSLFIKTDIDGSPITNGCSVAAGSAGKGILVVYSEVDENVYKEIPFEVVDDKNPVTGLITSDALNITLNRGQTFQTNISIEPTNAKYKDITYTSDNSSIATVSNTGLITGVMGGTTKIYATSHYGHQVVYNVTVNPILVTSIVVDPEEVWLLKGESTSWTVTTYPTNHDPVGKIMASDGDASAFEGNFLDSVTAAKNGTVYLTYTIEGNDSVSDMIKIRGIVLACKWSEWEPLTSYASSWLEAKNTAGKLVYETKTLESGEIYFRFRDADINCWGSWDAWADYTDDLVVKTEYYMEEGIKDCKFQFSPRSVWDEWSAWDIYNSSLHTPSDQKQVESKNQYQANTLKPVDQYKQYDFTWSSWSTAVPNSDGTMTGDIENRTEYGYQKVGSWSEYSTVTPSDGYYQSKSQYRSKTFSWSSWSTTKPSSTEQESKTQYGYQNVTSWDSNTVYTTAPSDGYYTTKTQYRSKTFSWSSWSTTNPSSSEKESKTQYGYQTVKTWSDYTTTTPSDSYYQSKQQYATKAFTWSSWSTTKPNVPEAQIKTGTQYRQRTYASWSSWSTTSSTVKGTVSKNQYRQNSFTWSDWSTTNPSSTEKESKTQYGYQTVATWKDEWLTTRPSDGYYTTRTLYGYQTVATWKDEWLTTAPSNGYYNTRTQYGYQTVATWKDEWLTTAPSDGYYTTRTQYGYQTVATWKDEWLTTKPSDGYYNTRTQYGYQTVATWKDEWLTTAPSDGYYTTRTQYGCQTPKSYSTTFSTSVPSSGYYKTGTQSTSTTKATGSFRGPATGSNSSVIDVGRAVYPTNIYIYTYCHTQVGTRTWYGSNDQSSWTKLGTSRTSKGSSSMEDSGLSLNVSTAYRYYRYVVSGVSAGYKEYSTDVWKCVGTGGTGAGYEQHSDIQITGYYNTSGYYEVATWNAAVYDSASAYTKTPTLKPVSRTTYRSPATWNTAVYDSATAYSKTTSRKPLSRTTYQGVATWGTTVYDSATAYTQTTNRKPVSRTTYRSPATWNTAVYDSATAYSKTTSRKPLSRTTYQGVATWNEAVYDSATPYTQTTNRRPAARTAYQTPATWNAPTGWRDSGAYSASNNTKPVLRTVHRYKVWGSYGAWTDCPSSGCPTTTTTNQVQTQTVYSYPVWSDWGSWTICPDSGCPTTSIGSQGSTSGRDVETRTVYANKVYSNSASGSWTDCPSSGCPANTDADQYLTRTVYSTPTAWNTATGWRDSGAYSASYNTKPATRTVYRYKIWPEFGAWAYCDGSCPASNDSTKIETRTVYWAPASWGSATGWRDGTAYEKTTSTKPLTRVVYRYKIWPEFGSWTDCSGACPTTIDSTKVETRTIYSIPTSWQAATGWTTSAPYTAAFDTKPVTRTTYRYKIWSTNGAWVDCPTSGCPANSAANRYDYQLIYRDVQNLSGWIDCNGACPTDTTQVIYTTRTVYRYRVLLWWDQLEYACRNNINIPVIVDNATPTLNSTFTQDGIQYKVIDATVNDGDGFEVAVVGSTPSAITSSNLVLNEVVAYSGSTPTSVYRVTKISTGAFIDCTFESLEVDYVEVIESKAFSNCQNLSSIQAGRLTSVAADFAENCPLIGK